MKLTFFIARIVVIAALSLAAAHVASAAQPLPPLKPYKGSELDMAGAVESPGFDSDTFTIACWLPNIYDLDKWARRGINVAWFNQRLNPKEKPLEEYVNKAKAAGMKMWRYPAEFMEPPADPSFDAKDSTLIAYSLLEEPILHHKSPDDMKEQAKAFKESNPKLKLILNVEGDKFVQPNPGK